MLRPRLLPIVICAASALLALKLVDLGVAVAETRDAGATAAPPQAAPAAAAPGDAAKPATPPPAAAAPADAAAPAAAPAVAPAADAAPKHDPLQMSPEEVSELQQLSQRRVELDKRAAELSEREVLMSAAEKRVDEKIAKLETLQKAIEADVKQKKSEEDAHIESLGHMYEQMKPQDAARILDQLDVPVVVTMLTHIREQKAAPILAAMAPEKAKAVTLALTQQKDVAAAPPAPSAPSPGQAHP
jgi:flagellar motility protein MotE (MotC chaperone)